MPAGLDRLGTSFCLSILLHLAILTGLPVGGGADSGPISRASRRLEVRLTRPAAVIEVDRAPELPGQPIQQPAGIAEAAGLPPSEEVGPPYPPQEPLYLAASRVDAMPRPLSSIDAVVDSLGDAQGVGRMVLILLVGSDGSVREVLVEASSLSTTFTESAVRAFGKVQFWPGVSNGRSVSTRLRLEVVVGYRRDISGGADGAMAGEKR